MDKLEILRKHIEGFKELKIPKEPKPSSNTEKYAKDYSRWESTKARATRLKQIQHLADGTVYGGSQYRIVRLQVPNPRNEDYFYLSSGEDYFKTIPELFPIGPFQYEVKANVNHLMKMSEIMAKALKVVRVTIDGDEMIFELPPKAADVIEISFIKASLKVENIGKGISFLVNPNYFISAMKLAKQLKIETVTLQLVNDLRPMQFVADDFTYLVSPVRSD